MGITRKVATNLLATMFMNERDALNNTMMRIASGFHPPSVLADARHQLQNINNIVQYVEEIVEKDKDTIIAQDFRELKGKMKLK